MFCFCYFFFVYLLCVPLNCIKLVPPVPSYYSSSPLSSVVGLPPLQRTTTPKKGKSFSVQSRMSCRCSLTSSYCLSSQLNNRLLTPHDDPFSPTLSSPTAFFHHISPRGSHGPRIHAVGNKMTSEVTQHNIESNKCNILTEESSQRRRRRLDMDTIQHASSSRPVLQQPVVWLVLLWPCRLSLLRNEYTADTNRNTRTPTTRAGKLLNHDKRTTTKKETAERGTSYCCGWTASSSTDGVVGDGSYNQPPLNKEGGGVGKET